MPQAGTIETRSCLHYVREIAEAPSYCEGNLHHPNCTTKVLGQSRTSGADGELGQSRTPSFNEELDQFITSIRNWARIGTIRGFICSCLFWVFLVLENIIKMTANPIVVNTNEFFCVPVGKSRQAAIFLGNLVKNAIKQGKRIPKRMEMSSDLGMCVKWIEDIGVPAIYAYSAYYSAKGREMMKGEGQSMRVALEFISKVFGQLSADECMLGWREFCSKGKKIVAALNQLCGEASLLAKNPELLNVTKYCIEGADMLRSIANIWDLALGVAEDNDEGSFKAAFHQDTPVGEVYKEFIIDKSTRASSSKVEELRGVPDDCRV